MAAVCDASIAAACCFATQDYVEVLNVELVKCMATRTFQTAMMVKVRPVGGSLMSSQVDEQVDSITLIQCHWPSSPNKRLKWQDKQIGVAGLTELAGRHGIILGDLNVHEKSALHDLMVHAAPQGGWRFSGSGPDWILYRQCFQQCEKIILEASQYYSDAHYPVCFVVTGNLVRSQVANDLAGQTRQAAAPSNPSNAVASQTCSNKQTEARR